MHINSIKNSINFKQNKSQTKDKQKEINKFFAGALGVVNGVALSDIIEKKKIAKGNSLVELASLAICVVGGIKASSLYEKLDEKQKEISKDLLSIVEGSLLGAIVAVQGKKDKVFPSVLIFSTISFALRKIYTSNRQTINEFLSKITKKIGNIYNKNEKQIQGAVEYLWVPGGRNK